MFVFLGGRLVFTAVAGLAGVLGGVGAALGAGVEATVAAAVLTGCFF